jgi:hypothetical protein
VSSALSLDSRPGTCRYLSQSVSTIGSG